MEGFYIFLTSLKNVAGAISDPLSVRKRNIGQDDAFIWYPVLENKADINHIDIDGFSPLAIAVDTQNAEIINLLLTYNPNFDNKDVVIGLLDLVEDENIVKTICRYYGIEKQKENEGDISADSK